MVMEIEPQNWRGFTSCPCLEEFCNFFRPFLGFVVKNLKNTRFAMRGDICFSRFSAPAYLWLQFAVAELHRVTDTGCFGHNQRKAASAFFTSYVAEIGNC